MIADHDDVFCYDSSIDPPDDEQIFPQPGS